MEWYALTNCYTFESNIKCCFFSSYFLVFMIFVGSSQVTPLFDTTITNIKLATHGGLDAMNAVLISSIAASTFNAQLEAWEPLVEPFDGIFKYHIYQIYILISAFISRLNFRT